LKNETVKALAYQKIYFKKNPLFLNIKRGFF